MEQTLARGAAALGLALPPEAPARLLRYLELLARWNRVYNLTAVRDPQQMVTRHLLDSLAVMPYVRGPRVLDVGSGAGLPGIPLALALPDVEFVLLDSSAKKTRFLIQAVSELRLDTVSVERARVEDYRAARGFDTVVARAVSSLTELVARGGPLCARDGRILALKGAAPKEELAALPAGYRSAGIYPLHVPGLARERHLVWVVPDPAST
ncbi:MAG: 16S rRNA (guanine(527)-N(7))-methyltransferase RsmG [Gammaproteobacteria bacterium]|nr:16S rRNA (guanine(527)-N(7))-methyltransferase RsmG [Gammaproteobacteria bacterium]